MIELLLLAAGLLGVSMLALSCCGPPTSSKLSFNQSSHDQGMATAIDADGYATHRSRTIKIVEAENINHDVKEKTLEDERKEMRRRTAREKINRPRVRRSKSRQEQPKMRRKPTADKDRSASEKKDDKGKKDAGRPPSTSEQVSRQSESKKADKEGDGDESTKDGGGGGCSKTPGDNSFKGKSSVGGLPSTERVGTNETMVSRERADEVESAKLKRAAAAASPKTPMNNSGVTAQSAETQGESEKPKKTKSPPRPKRRLNKKREEEVREWNAAIARGNVFRPRKDDETIDEVHVDWNT